MRLARSELSLSLTQHGYLFLGILVAMLLGSINYNNNAGFILVFLLGGMAAISLFHSYGNLKGTQIIPMHVQPVFMGQPVVLPLTVRPAAGQVAEGPQALHLGFQDRPLVPFSGKGVVSLKTPSLHRGYQPLENLVVESVYPFGLFRLRAVLPVNARALVYPAPLQGELPGAAGGSRDRGKETLADQGPDDFQGLKTYVPGHPMGRISWKTFSRGQGLFVKDFTAQGGGDILFDPDLIQGKDLETRLSLICQGIIDAEKLNLRYGLRLDSTRLSPARGTRHYHACLRAMALHPKEKVS